MRLPVSRVIFWLSLAAEVCRQIPYWIVRHLAGPLAAGDAETVEVCRDHAVMVLSDLARSLRCRCGNPQCLARRARRTCLLMGLSLIVGISPAGEAYRLAMIQEMDRHGECKGR